MWYGATGMHFVTGPDWGAGAEDKHTAHWWESLQCTQLTRVGALMGRTSSGRIRVFSDDPGHGVGISRRGIRPDTETHGGQSQQCRKGDKEEVSTDSSGTDGKRRNGLKHSANNQDFQILLFKILIHLKSKSLSSKIHYLSIIKLLFLRYEGCN